MEVLDVVNDLSKLSTWANLGSLGGFLISLWVIQQQVITRKRYLLLIRGPQIQDELLEKAELLNTYGELDSSQQKKVFAETRTALKASSTYLGAVHRLMLFSLRFRLWKNRNSYNETLAEEAHAEIHRTSGEFRQRILDSQARQQ